MNANGLWGVLITGILTVPDAEAPGGKKKIVFQRTHPDFGNIPSPGNFGMQRRRHVIPADPRTPYQIALRARIGAATAAWHALDESARDTYRDAANGARHTGFNQFVSDWCRAHPLDAADYAQQIQVMGLPAGYRLLGAPLPLDFAPSGAVRLNLA